MKNPCVYILARGRNGTLYTGVTADLPKRVYEHKQDLLDGFTKQYGVHTLVWYEIPRSNGHRVRARESDQEVEA